MTQKLNQKLHWTTTVTEKIMLGGIGGLTVVAAGFDRPLPIGGTMAIEPKVVHADGSIGSEDTWIRDEDGMRPVTADGAWPWLTEW